MSDDSVILALIHDTKSTRMQVAEMYAEKIAHHSFHDISAVNEHIVDRWSQSALVYVKKQALKICFGESALN